MDLSIIIPTLNRAPQLRVTLQSIAAQVSDCTYEVIVVDNGSTDQTRNVCQEAGQQLKQFTYIYDATPGLLTGRHRGAAQAAAPLLSFIDDDVELNAGWINAVVTTFGNHPEAALLGGPSLPRFTAYPPSWLSHFWQSTPYGGRMCLPLSLLDLGEGMIEVDPCYIFGLNYSIRTAVFRALGGFHPDRIPDSLQRYQGDGETGLSIKAKNNNYKSFYVSSAFLYHFVPAERLQVAYFEKWHYYSGICNSFTQIRTGHNLYDASEKLPPKPLLPVRILRKANSMLRRLKDPDPVPKNIADLQEGFDIQYREGYNFHQQAFKTDKQVRNWVLKSDYWNYNLPA